MQPLCKNKGKLCRGTCCVTSPVLVQEQVSRQVDSCKSVHVAAEAVSDTHDAALPPACHNSSPAVQQQCTGNMAVGAGQDLYPSCSSTVSNVWIRRQTRERGFHAAADYRGHRHTTSFTHMPHGATQAEAAPCNDITKAVMAQTMGQSWDSLSQHLHKRSSMGYGMGSVALVLGRLLRKDRRWLAARTPGMSGRLHLPAVCASGASIWF